MLLEIAGNTLSKKIWLVMEILRWSTDQVHQMFLLPTSVVGVIEMVPPVCAHLLKGACDPLQLTKRLDIGMLALGAKGLFF